MSNIFKNNDLFSSISNNNSFYSFESKPRKFKLINKKRKGTYIGNNIFHKINKIQKSQNKANQKLDLILSLIKSKILGEYEYNIYHYDLCIPKLNKSYKKIKEKENKEENDLNIKDDFGLITTIKKEPYNPSANIYRKKLKKESDNKNNSTGNLSQIIDDFLYENKKEKNNYKDNENNNKDDNIYNNLDNESKNNCKNNDNKNKDIINNDIKDEIEENNILNNNIFNNKNVNIFDDINKNINSLLNNLNKSYKKDIDLNKYKFESKKEINSYINNNLKANSKKDLIELNNDKNDIINNCDKVEIKEETKKIEKDENFEDYNNIKNNENININEERKNMDNNFNEDEKEMERKTENCQSDSLSVKSIISNSSAKKSNQGSSRKIRGFNFKNNIKIKKYNGKKFDPSSSTNDKENK